MEEEVKKNVAADGGIREWGRGQGKVVEAWLPRADPWWKHMECGHRAAARTRVGVGGGHGCKMGGRLLE